MGLTITVSQPALHTAALLDINHSVWTQRYTHYYITALFVYLFICQIIDLFIHSNTFKSLITYLLAVTLNSFLSFQFFGIWTLPALTEQRLTCEVRCVLLRTHSEMSYPSAPWLRASLSQRNTPSQSHPLLKSHAEYPTVEIWNYFLKLSPLAVKLFAFI